uniref:Uncharacterized protein n=1 Tax=Cyanoderma ruficeps TaxID=181631 RepID=A0A8C3R9T7_9PASS
ADSSGAKEQILVQHLWDNRESPGRCRMILLFPWNTSGSSSFVPSGLGRTGWPEPRVSQAGLGTGLDSLESVPKIPKLTNPLAPARLGAQSHLPSVTAVLELLELPGNAPLVTLPAAMGKDFLPLSSAVPQ